MAAATSCIYCSDIACDLIEAMFPFQGNYYLFEQYYVEYVLKMTQMKAKKKKSVKA